MNNLSLDTVCAALGIDPLTRGLQVFDAAHLARLHFPPLDPNTPALIARLDTRALAAECQRALSLLYPSHHLVTRIYSTNPSKVAAPGESKGDSDNLDKYESLMLGTLARVKYPATPSILFIPPLARPGSFNAFANIVAHLRSPVGCPWDRAQTHQSLRKDFLEECYEVLETLDENDIPHLREELGDLMLHILLQTQIAFQSGEFGLSEVFAEISEKLVRRHPHVFGDLVVNGTDEIVANWEKIKQSEKLALSGAEGSKAKSSKRGISFALPALMHAQKIAKKEKKKVAPAEIEKLARRLPRARNKEQVLGQALFALAAYAQEKHLDAESALRNAAARSETLKK